MIRFDKFNINNIDTEIKKIVGDHILITYYLFHAKIYCNNIILIL
jgi:hypothetical protein